MRGVRGEARRFKFLLFRCEARDFIMRRKGPEDLRSSNTRCSALVFAWMLICTLHEPVEYLQQVLTLNDVWPFDTKLEQPH